MSLVDTSMVPFQQAYPMIAFMIILILAGNTAFVCPPLHSNEYSHLTIARVSSPYCKFVLRFHPFKYTETL